MFRVWRDKTFWVGKGEALDVRKAIAAIGRGGFGKEGGLAGARSAKRLIALIEECCSMLLCALHSLRCIALSEISVADALDRLGVSRRKRPSVRRAPERLQGS